jgi:hypothetical protein
MIKLTKMLLTKVTSNIVGTTLKTKAERTKLIPLKQQDK